MNATTDISNSTTSLDEAFASTYIDLALPMAELGIPTILVREKSKIALESEWQKKATTDVDTIIEQDRRHPKANCGLVAQNDGFCFFESDQPGVIRNFETETGESFKTRTHSSRPGHFHFIFKNSDLTRKIGNIVQSKLGFGSFRQNNSYILAPGSIHPETGKPYTVVLDAPIIDAPDPFMRWLQSKIKETDFKAAPSPAASSIIKITEGGRNSALAHWAGKYRREGLTADEIETVLLRINDEECDPPLCEKEVRTIARSIGNYEKGSTTPTLLINGKDAETGVQVTAPAASVVAPAVEAASAGIQVTIPYSEDIFYGLAGRVIRKLQPQTESHPVGNLLEFLAVFGNIVGASAYFQVEDTRHYTNLFIVRVGKSSRSRKGTGRNRIERVAAQLDSNWYATRNTSGLGSGEIVVHEIRDAVTASVFNKKTQEFTSGIADPGVADKRLYVSEGEFAGVLTVAGRQDSILSKIIRDGWDSKPLRNKAKSGSVVCLNPHISISADITREELNGKVKESEKFNGFCNRFLWCFVERQGSKPHGGEEIDWAPEIIDLFKCVEFTRKQRRIFMDRNARAFWERIYDEFQEEVPGVPGAVTSRGEAQVIRLALLFAMLDMADHIGVEHLKAAKALWQYCEDSARIIFGGVMKEHQRILDFLKSGPKSITEIREKLFAKHRKVEEIRTDLNTLWATGMIYPEPNTKDTFHKVGS